MTEVISIQFRGKGKSYFFDPAGFTIKSGDKVIVETSRGVELGDCTEGAHMVDDMLVVQPVRPVLRLATAEDIRQAEANRKLEQDAFGIAEEKILKHELEMKLVDVECSFDGSKILFFFTADGRVDFRELVKDLAGVFRTRIELRQIGVRDEAKMMGGIGICGQPFCCTRFMSDFLPVSTKMAKTQSLSLNPTKISGCCGRLMCCLRYEQEAYEDLNRHMPKNGAFVQTAEGYGNIVQQNLLRQTVKVKLDGNTNNPVIHSFSVDEIAEVPGGRPREGEPLPQVLVVKPKKQEEEIRDEWAMPELFAGLTGNASEPEEVIEETEPEETEETSAVKRPSRRRSRHGRNGRGTAKTAEPKQEMAEKAEKPEKTEKPVVKVTKVHKPKAQAQNTPKSAEKSVKARPAKETPAEEGETAAKKSHSRRRYYHRPKSGKNKT